MAYNAGTAFITVAPAFEGFVAKVEAELARIKDVDVKVTPKVDTKAAKTELDKLGKPITPTVKPDVDTAKAETEIGAFATAVNRTLAKATKSLGDGVHEQVAEIDAALASIKEAHINAEFDDTELLAEIAKVRGELDALGKDTNLDISTRFDASKARAELDALTKDINATLNVDVDTTKATAEIGAFAAAVSATLDKATKSLGDGVSTEVDKINAEIASIRDAHINAELDDTELLAELAKVRAELDALAKDTTLDIGARFDAAKARAEIDALTKDIKATIEVEADTTAASAKIAVAARNRKSTINVDADTGAATSKLAALGALQSKLNIGSLATRGGLLALGVASAPALAPPLVAGAGIAGAGLLGVSGLAGVGASLVGNITQAIKAQKDLTTAQQAATTAASAEASAQQAVQSAMDTLKTAEEGVTVAEINRNRAVHDAAEAVAVAQVQATEAVRSAEEGLTTAQQNALTAQDALNEARKTAKQILADMEDTLKGAALAESGAALAVRQAALTLKQVEGNPDSTKLQIAQAVQGLKEARLAYDEAQTANNRTKKSAEEARKAGVDGNKDVVSAQQQLQGATQGVADAQHNLSQARTDGARAVADAQRNLAQARSDGARSIADAQRQVAVAQQGVADAQAHEAATSQALAAANEAVNAAQRKLDPQAVQAFTNALADLKNTWQDFLSATAGPVLGVAVAAMKVLSQLLVKFEPVTKAAANAVKGLFDRFSGFSASPLFERFLRVLQKFGPILIKNFGITAVRLLRGVIRLFLDFEPLMAVFSRAMARGSNDFRKFTIGFGKSDTFQSFISFVKENGPVVGDVLKDIAKFITKLVTAAAPLAASGLKILKPALDWLANLKPNQILIVAAAIAALINPIGGAALAIAALVANLKDLYNSSPQFKKFADGVGAQLGRITGDLGKVDWAKTFSGAKEAFAPLVGDLEGVLKSALNAIHSFTRLAALLWKLLGHDIIEATGTWLGGLLQFIKGGFQILSGLFKLVADLIRGDWSGVWKDLKQIASGAVNELEGLLKMAWAVIKLGLEAFVKVFGRIWQTLWDGYQRVLKIAVDGIETALSKAWDAIKSVASTAWDGIKSVITTGINAVVDVINVLLDGINTVLSWVGINTHLHINHVGGSDNSNGNKSGNTSRHMGQGTGAGVGMAQGGVLPGYTPGSDVHHFYSPTGGRLDLSGGEGVMVPEWVRAVGGASAVHQMNHEARQGFAKGGMVGAGPIRQFRGVTLDTATINGILRAEKLIHQVFHLVQGSYSTSVAASGGTHAGGGAFDASSPWTNQAVGALRKAGPFAAWLRDPSQGPWARHIHAVLIGDPNLSPEAAAQVRAFMAGGDGLGGADYGPHVGPAYGGRSFSESGLGNAPTGSPGGLLASIPNPLTYLKGVLSKALGDAPAALDSPFGKALLKLPGKLLSEVGSKVAGMVASKVGGLLGGAASAVGSLIPGGGGLGGASARAYQAWAKAHLKNYGWGADQFQPLLSLWNKESGWSPTAVNPKGGNPATSAYGIPQSLPGSKMAAAGSDWITNPVTQMRWGLSNIKAGYGDPAAAWAHSVAYNWYDQGGIANGAGLMPKRVIAPERVLSAQQTQSFDRLVNNLTGSGSGGPMQVRGTFAIGKDGVAYLEGLADGRIDQSNQYRGYQNRVFPR